MRSRGWHSDDVIDDNPLRFDAAPSSRFSVKRRTIWREGRGFVSNIPYRNAGAFLVLQRVILASRATALHDECFRANVSRSSIDLSRGMTAVHRRFTSPCSEYIFLTDTFLSWERLVKRMVESSSLRGPSHRKNGIRWGNVRQRTDVALRRRRRRRLPRSSLFLRLALSFATSASSYETRATKESERGNRSDRLRRRRDVHTTTQPGADFAPRLPPGIQGVPLRSRGV